MTHPSSKSLQKRCRLVSPVSIQNSRMNHKSTESWNGEDEIPDESETQHHGPAPVRPHLRSSTLEPVDPNAVPIHAKPDTAKKSGSTRCCAGCLWTRQLTSETNKEAFILTTLIELFIYVIYLIICCIVVYGTISPTAYYYTKVLSDLFLDTPFAGDSSFPDQATKTFRTSADVKDFWTFAGSSMLNALYWEEWYDDAGLEKPVETQDQGILYENRIIGRPRLRQIRVANKSCPIMQSLQNLEKKCYPDYSSTYEETANYSSSQGGSAWIPVDDLSTQSYWGQLETYAGSGAYLLLGLRRSDTEKLIDQLKKNLWITRATRVVFLELTVYNANLNIFCTVRLAWEFSVTGGLVTSWNFRTFQLFRYIRPVDYFYLACEIIFILFTIYYTIQEIVEVFCLGIRKYLTEVWSYLDLLILALSYLCIGFTIYKTVLIVKDIAPSLSNSINEFTDFSFIAFWESQFVNTIAILLFFCWIKIFKYISFNRTMSQLSTTLSRCSKDIFGFGIMFFIVFMAFAQLGYLLFGSQVRSFSSMYASCFTLLRLLLGDFQFREIEAANRILGPAFYLLYIFLVFFVLLNMFLAIINDTYSEVKAEIQAHTEEYRISDYLLQHFAFWKKKPANPKMGTEGLDSAADGKITHHEIQSHLIQAYYTHDEITLFLARYALDSDEVPLDEEETENLILELGSTSKSASRNDWSHGDDAWRSQTSSESERVDKRITAMESSLTTLIGQLEEVLSKIPEAELRHE